MSGFISLVKFVGLEKRLGKETGRTECEGDEKGLSRGNDSARRLGVLQRSPVVLCRDRNPRGRLGWTFANVDDLVLVLVVLIDNLYKRFIGDVGFVYHLVIVFHLVAVDNGLGIPIAVLLGHGGVDVLDGSRFVLKGCKHPSSDLGEPKPVREGLREDSDRTGAIMALTS
jgi:hypothetical protein